MHETRGVRVATGVVRGVSGEVVVVDVSVSPGLPHFSVTGVEGASAKAASAALKERVIGALRASGCQGMVGRLQVAFHTAHQLSAAQPGHDLAVALGVLRASGQVASANLDRFLVLGELTPAGVVRGVRGVLPMVEAAAAAGLEGVLVPASNAAEAALVPGVRVLAVSTLLDVVRHLSGREPLSPVVAGARAQAGSELPLDMSQVRGLEREKAALELAAAGGHGLLLVGPAGSGKVALARRLTTILPPMSEEEKLGAARVWSVAGMLPESGQVGERPFRAPHHSISEAGLIGGGVMDRPGEASLAHNGVLFLDELSDFRKVALESLQAALRAGEVVLARMGEEMRLPADVALVGSMLPCPCGFAGAGLGRPTCRCSRPSVDEHWARVAPFVRNNMDMRVRMVAPAVESAPEARPSAYYRERVLAARKRQQGRYAGTELRLNADLTPATVDSYCFLSTGAAVALESFARTQGGLTAEERCRILALALTRADLECWDGSIQEEDMVLALSLREGAMR